MAPTPKFESQFTKERLRQARQAFNLAFVCITSCVVATFIGISLVYSGKVAFGVVAGVAGTFPIARCIKLYREANDRLDELMNESDDDDKKKETSDDEENAPA
jgi:hypothetical protein